MRLQFLIDFFNIMEPLIKTLLILSEDESLKFDFQQLSLSTLEGIFSRLVCARREKIPSRVLAKIEDRALAGVAVRFSAFLQNQRRIVFDFARPSLCSWKR